MDDILKKSNVIKLDTSTNFDRKRFDGLTEGLDDTPSRDSKTPYSRSNRRTDAKPKLVGLAALLLTIVVGAKILGGESSPFMLPSLSLDTASGENLSKTQPSEIEEGKASPGQGEVIDAGASIQDKSNALLSRSMPMKTFLTEVTALQTSGTQEDFTNWKRGIEHLLTSTENREKGKDYDDVKHKKLVDYIVYLNRKVPHEKRVAFVEELELVFKKQYGVLVGYDFQNYSGDSLQAYLNRTSNKSLETDAKVAKAFGVKIASNASPTEFSRTILSSHRTDLRTIGASYLMLNNVESTIY